MARQQFAGARGVDQKDAAGLQPLRPSLLAGPQHFIDGDPIDPQRARVDRRHRPPRQVQHMAMPVRRDPPRSEEHTSELQSLMRISYAVFCLKKKNKINMTKREKTLTHEQN